MTTTTSVQQLGRAAAIACACWAMPHAALAQQAYGRVLDATPIYEQVAVPQETCTDFARHTRCATSTAVEEQLVGYDVLYEYNGQQYAQRMARNPGKRVPIQTTEPGHNYGSSQRASASGATPGAKSYGSVAPGAPVVESIQYQSNDPDIPVLIDMRKGRPPHQR